MWQLKVVGRVAADAGVDHGVAGCKEIAARLVAALTDAVARVLGEQVRSGTSVEFVATREGRTSIGGVIPESPCGFPLPPGFST